MIKRYSQQGSVLIVSLVLLLVLTILGISSIDNTIMEEKMAGNLSQRNQGFQASEAALRLGEEELLGLSKDTKIDPSGDGSSGIWIENDPGTIGTGAAANLYWYREWDIDDDWKPLSYTDTDGVVRYACVNSLSNAGSCNSGYNGVFQNTATDMEGYYLIEYDERKCDSITIGQQSDQTSFMDYYKVTSLGLGPGGHSKVYLRSKVGRRY